MSTTPRSPADQGSAGWKLEPAELLAYRHQLHLASSMAPRQIRATLAGGYLSKHKGRGMEFVETRHYQAGDDIRAIDWRVTARTGKTHTKLFQEEKERPVFVMVDFSQSMLFGSQFRFKAVQAAHMATLIGWSAIARGDRLGGLIFTEQDHHELRPRSRQAAILRLINSLTTHYPQWHGQHRPAALNDALTRLRRVAHPGSQIYLLSDFLHLDETGVKQLKLLSRHNDVIAVELFDPLERTLPENARQDLQITDGERNMILALHSRRQRQQYQARLTQLSQLRHQHLLQAGVRYQAVGAHDTLQSQLAGFDNGACNSATNFTTNIAKNAGGRR